MNKRIPKKHMNWRAKMSYAKNITVLLLLVFVLPEYLHSQNKEEFRLTPIGKEGFKVMSEFLNYDKGMPLNVRVVEENDEASYIREKVIFTGSHDSRVPAYFAKPKHIKYPLPAVMLIHGITGSKDNWWGEDEYSLLTKKLLSAGYAVFSADVQYHGERMAANDYENVSVFAFQKDMQSRLRDMQGQSVKDHRHAIDYLESRSDVDSAKIAVVGYSNGGMIVFNLASVDSRIKVAVSSVNPIIKQQYSILNSFNFAPYITNTPFLMLNGKTDKFSSISDSKKLFGYIGSKEKEIKFYNSGHHLPIEWTDDALDWLNKQLKKQH